MGRGELLAFLCDTGGMDRRHVGKIELLGGQASVEVSDGWESRLVRILDGALLGHRRIRARVAAGPKTIASKEDHFQRLSRLLDLESRAEAQRVIEAMRRIPAAELERGGKTLTDLVLDDEYSGLGGRLILTLVKRNRSAGLPWTRLDVGSPVLLSPDGEANPAGEIRGVVSERHDRWIRVAVARFPEEGFADAIWRLDLSTDEVACQRQLGALERARSASGDRLADLRRVLLGDRPPAFQTRAEATPQEREGADAGTAQGLGFLDPSLNESQRQAVTFALAASDLALIHGPPGTGKTTTLVELIRQAVRRGEKVLTCAPSNLAVDNLFERLLAAGEHVVRLGHPARVLPGLREHTLDLLVENHEHVRIARKLVREALALRRKASKFTRAKPEPGARREMRLEAGELLADARRLEAQAIESILDAADILCSTTTSLDSAVLGQRRFGLAVIDEACQSAEPGCWIPLLRCDRVVLAGDHCQLPPTVVSPEAAAEGLGISLFERLVALHGPDVTRRLKIQYRMHEAIMEFSSLEFYDAELEADPSVQHHRLCDLPGVKPGPLTETPVLYMDTAGAGFDEEIEADGESRLNPREAEQVCRKVQDLLDAGVAASDIAVIAPYSAHVRLLRDKLRSVAGLEIDSVDGFQGREKEAVVISLVRSNPQNDIGFLADVRRMNVALTRARRKLVVIGDSATLSSEPFYQRLFEHFERLKAYRSVWEVDASPA